MSRALAGTLPPKSRLDYWLPKLSRNKEWDASNVQALEAAGWRILIVWECETRDAAAVAMRLHEFLGPPGTRGGWLLRGFLPDFLVLSWYGPEVIPDQLKLCLTPIGVIGHS